MEASEAANITTAQSSLKRFEIVILNLRLVILAKPQLRGLRWAGWLEDVDDAIELNCRRTYISVVMNMAAGRNALAFIINRNGAANAGPALTAEERHVVSAVSQQRYGFAFFHHHQEIKHSSCSVVRFDVLL